MDIRSLENPTDQGRLVFEPDIKDKLLHFVSTLCRFSEALLKPLHVLTVRQSCLRPKT